MRQEPGGVVSFAAIPNRTTRPLRPHRPDRHPASPLLVRAHCPESAGSGTRKPPSPPRRTLILGGWQNRAFSDPLRGTEKTRFLAPCGAKSGGGGGAPPTTLILLRNQCPVALGDRACSVRPSERLPDDPRDPSGTVAGLPLSPSSGWPPSEPVEAAARSSSRSSSRSSPPPHRVLLASVPPAPAVCDAESESEGWSPCSARLPPDGLRSDGWRTRSGRLRLTPTFALAIQPPRIDASASRRCCDTQDACRARYRQPRSATRHARLLPRPFALLRRYRDGSIRLRLSTNGNPLRVVCKH